MILTDDLEINFNILHQKIKVFLNVEAGKRHAGKICQMHIMLINDNGRVSDGGSVHFRSVQTLAKKFQYNRTERRDYEHAELHVQI